MKFIIKYGTEFNNIDVTDIVLEKCKINNSICIPENDERRACLFTDPVFGIKKYIFIVDRTNNNITVYDSLKKVYIDIENHQLYNSDDVPYDIKELHSSVYNRLRNIQKNLKIQHGSFNEEYPEQCMAIRFLTGNEKILEIGANIGRNTLIMSSILKSKNNNNLVSMETDAYIAGQLEDNRKINHLDFHIENSALSKRKLIQKNWNTIPSDVLLPGYSQVNIISFEELKQKYNINFDTLVLDCEGAFYYILMDMPEILDNIQLIIMENDYLDATHKKYVDNMLTQNNFSVVYEEPGNCNIVFEKFYHCHNCFYQVWKKI